MSLFGNLGSNNQPAASGAAPKSLFGGATPATSSSTPSLFGGLSGSTPGQTGTPQPATTGGLGGGLFSNLGGAKTSAPAATSSSGFSFGGATAQPQAKPLGGLFASTAGQQQQQSTAANPLSNLQQTTTGAQNSLFGATSNQPQQQQQQQPQQQPQGGPLAQSNAGSGRSAHFDHLLERGRKRNAGENGLTNFDELPTLQLGLGDIARKVRNLGTGGPSADQAQDRAAHYLLSASGVKMGSTLRDLNQFTAQAGLSTGGPAPNFMDTDVDGYLSNLHSQSTLALIQDGLEQSKRDFDTFLEDNVQIEWDKQRQKIYEHFGLGKQSEDLAASQVSFGNTAAKGAFGRSNRKGRSMGPKASTNGASFGTSGARPVLGSVLSPYGKGSVNGRDTPERSVASPGNGPINHFVRDKQEDFMSRIKELNETRLRENHFPVLHRFKDVEKRAAGDNSDHFINAYDALISITGESESNVGPDTPKERGFISDYLDEQPNSVKSLAIRKRILDGSRKFLEKQFLDKVERDIRTHARDAVIGGVPSVLNKIRGFVRVRLIRKDLGAEVEQLQKIGGEGEEFPWVIVFYLLRAGLTTEAAAYVRDKRNFFANNDRNFQAAISHYASDPDRRLSQELQQKMNHVYAQRSRIAPTNDPYRMACYKIIGRCELTRRNLEPIKENMDDWVWLQFNLAREGNRAEENAGEIFGLEELRSTIHDIGQRHFMSDSAESAGGYGVYFYLATLAGMFEQAINFLYQHNYVTAIHYAIALDYYGLLRVSDWSNGSSDILTFTTKQQPQFNFCRAVGIYTADFRAARADAAAEYLVLLCLNADLPGSIGKQQADICHEALRELVLETREFATLLGDVKTNGQVTPGLIQERIPLIKMADDNSMINTIIREAAKMADDNGRTNDAVLLCLLAAEYDTVVVIINRALSEALSVDLGQEPLRLEPLKPRLAPGEEPAVQSIQGSSSLSMLATDDPVELAHKVIALYDANSIWWRTVMQSNRETLQILFKLNEAKKIIEAGRYTQALDEITRLRILPLDANGNLTQIRSTATNFSTYLPEIARNIGNVLLWCIGCCSRHREVLLSGHYEDPTRKALADKLLQMAKDLMVFAGLIRYKLPPRVFETLAKEGQDVGAY